MKPLFMQKKTELSVSTFRNFSFDLSKPISSKKFLLKFSIEFGAQIPRNVYNVFKI